MFKSLQISNALALEDWLRWTDRKKDYWSHGLRHKAEIWYRWSDGLNGLRQNLLDQLHHDRPHSHPHSQPHLSQGFESVPCLLHSRLPSYYYKKSRIDLRKKKTRSMKWSEGKLTSKKTHRILNHSTSQSYLEQTKIHHRPQETKQTNLRVEWRYEEWWSEESFKWKFERHCLGKKKRRMIWRTV